MFEQGNWILINKKNLLEKLNKLSIYYKKRNEHINFSSLIIYNLNIYLNLKKMKSEKIRKEFASR